MIIKPKRDFTIAAPLRARLAAIAEPNTIEAACQHAALIGNGPRPLMGYGDGLQDMSRDGDSGLRCLQVITATEKRVF